MNLLVTWENLLFTNKPCLQLDWHMLTFYKQSWRILIQAREAMTQYKGTSPETSLATDPKGER